MENQPDNVEKEQTQSSKKQRTPLATGADWTFDLIQDYDAELARIAAEYRLDTYPNQIEVISSEQMLDAYASVGMPLMYNHWSFGKHFLSNQQRYQSGQMGLAYEIVINSNPCIAYLMEENTMAMQILVLAHASYGHNSFFKGNYLFRTWTDAESIIDYLMFAKGYISECEEKYGIDAVEEVLDACHALMNQGVNRYKRPRPLSAGEEEKRQKERAEYIQRTFKRYLEHHTSARKNARKKPGTFSQRPRRKHSLFYRKECASAGNMAERAGSHCSKSGTVLLSPATNPGYE